MTPDSNILSYQGHTPILGSGLYIDRSATIIGDVSLGDHASVWPGCVIRGDVNHIRIGPGSNVQDLSVLHVSHKSSWDPGGSPLLIGSNVTIGHRVILHGCTIEDECLVGMGSIVMDKAILRRHVLLAAGSLVPEGHVLDSGFLYLGSPAKKIRALSADEIAHFLYSAQHYMRLKEQYRSEGHGSLTD